MAISNRRGTAAVVALWGALAAGQVAAGSASRAEFGALADGRRVEAVTLRNSQGVEATVINLGATLQSLVMPDREGRREDVVLGHASLEGYLARPEYFGATVGRFANRIAHGRFELDGEVYQTPQNDNGHALHGGDRGFDKRLWDIVAVRGGDVPGVQMRHVSRDGEQGYPGTLAVTATYSLNDANELRIEYEATTDRATIVNITNHAYWNLAGEGAPAGAMAHVLTIPAQEFTPVDAGLIPTGELRKVEGTVFDFREPVPIGLRVRNAADPQIAYGRGYDHNFVVARSVSQGLRLLARLEDPASGRGFELWSNQPGLQLYSGNFLDGTIIGKSGRAYRQGDAVVLEPQRFPDTPNRPHFGSARLDAGETYRNVIVYRLFVRDAPQARR